MESYQTVLYEEPKKRFVNHMNVWDTRSVDLGVKETSANILRCISSINWKQKQIDKLLPEKASFTSRESNIQTNEMESKTIGQFAFKK